jgi:excisionase family DNA binding protein
MNEQPRNIDPTTGPAGRRLNRAAREGGMEYWRVERVARYLDVSKKRVYQLVQERRLAAVRLGPRQMRVTRASLDAYLLELHQRAQEEADY